jgi:hypothetical protein
LKSFIFSVYTITFHNFIYISYEPPPLYPLPPGEGNWSLDISPPARGGKVLNLSFFSSPLTGEAWGGDLIFRNFIYESGFY